MKKRKHWMWNEEVVPAETGEISAGVPPYDSDVTNKALP